MSRGHAEGVFPFEPVKRLLELRLPEIVVEQLTTGHPVTIAAGDHTRASEVLHVSRRVLGRWAGGALLTTHMADHVATRLGRHPSDLWPDWDEVWDRLDAERQEQRRVKAARHRARRAVAA